MPRELFDSATGLSTAMNKEFIKYIAGRFIPAFVSIISIVLAIRFLGPLEYGRFSLLVYTVLIVITLGFHWVQVSILRFLSGMPRERTVVMSRFFDLTILCALFSTAIVVLLGIFYFHLSVMELSLVGLFAFLNHFYLFHQAILHAYNRTMRNAILEGSDQLLIIIVLLAGLFLFHWQSSMLLFTAMLIGLIGFLALRAVTRVKGLLQVDLKHLYWDSRFSAKAAEFGYGVAFWLLLSHLLMAADRFVVMEYLGYGEAGVYSALKDLLYKCITFASYPIYLSYQSKVLDYWNSKHRMNAWSAIREAISFEILIFVIVFVAFMVAKQKLFNDLMQIPEADTWLIYLPILFAAFVWQIALLVQRFLELFYRPTYMILSIAGSVLLNIVLNLVFVPVYGLMASSFALLLASLLYTGFILVPSFMRGKKLAEE